MVFKWLRSRLSMPGVVVELSDTRLQVRSLAEGSPAAFECKPILSVDSNNVIVSIGHPVAPTATHTYAPFATLSTLQNEASIASKIVAHAFQSMLGMGRLRPAPRVLVHLSLADDNPLQTADDAVLKRVLDEAGAYFMVIHRGRKLSDASARELLGNR